MTFTKIAELGRLDDEDFPAVDPNAGLAITREGNFLTSNLQVNRVLVYNAAGKLVRVVGASGSGPGEFSSLRQISVIGKDTILVGDANRMHMFAPDFKLLATVALSTPYMRSFVALSGGRYLTVLRTDRRLEPQPVVVGRDAYERAATGNAPEPECPTCNWSLSSRLREGGAWLARGNRNVLERWSPSGELMRTVTFVGSTWFKPWFNPSSTPEHPYKSVIAGIDEDVANRVWIVGHYQTPDAKPGRTLQSFQPDADGHLPVPPGGFAPNAAIQAQWISVVDVFDPVTGLLYVSHVIPGKAIRLLTPPYFSQAVESPDGFDVIHIYRMDITKRKKSQRK